MGPGLDEFDEWQEGYLGMGQCGLQLLGSQGSVCVYNGMERNGTSSTRGLRTLA